MLWEQLIKEPIRLNFEFCFHFLKGFFLKKSLKLELICVCVWSGSSFRHSEEGLGFFGSHSSWPPDCL